MATQPLYHHCVYVMCVLEMFSSRYSSLADICTLLCALFQLHLLPCQQWSSPEKAICCCSPLKCFCPAFKYTAKYSSLIIRPLQQQQQQQLDIYILSTGSTNEKVMKIITLSCYIIIIIFLLKKSSTAHISIYLFRIIMNFVFIAPFSQETQLKVRHIKKKHRMNIREGFCKINLSSCSCYLMC